jgi:hypothetical protein
MVQDIYSSRTYVCIRRVVLVSLYGVSDLSKSCLITQMGYGFER